MRTAVPHYMTDMDKAPPGHRFGLYFKGWTNDWKLDGQQKQQALGSVANLGGDERKYLSSLIKRQQTAAGKLGDALFATVAQSTAPFVTGMGYEHPLENGFAFLNPYGLPYLPGSSIKGVLRRAAEELVQNGEARGFDGDDIHYLFGPENPGDDARRGALNFWDAFPDGQLTIEIMTPHHSDFLQQGGTPHDSEKPNPIPFLAVAPGAKFHFFVQRIGDVGDRDWEKIVDQCYRYAWDWLGFGAKTAVGYGAMIEDPAIVVRRRREEEARCEMEADRRRQEEEQRRRDEERRKAEEAEARRRAELAAMPAHERAVVEAEQKLAGLRGHMRLVDKSGYGGVRHLIKELLELAQGEVADARMGIAEWIERTLNGLENGWRHPDLNAKKRKQWEKKVKQAIEGLRGG